MKRILIVTDAWHPQVNGVVRCLDNVGDELKCLGHTVEYLTPERFWTMPLLTYPEIRVSLAHWAMLNMYLMKWNPISFISPQRSIRTTGAPGLFKPPTPFHHKLSHTVC